MVQPQAILTGFSVANRMRLAWQPNTMRASIILMELD